MSESTGPTAAPPGARSARRGAIKDEGLIPADEDGLARLVLKAGAEVNEGCVEMMSGRDLGARPARAEPAGRSRSPTPARSGTSPRLPARPSKVDARVLADLRRRDLVPALAVPSLQDRAIRGRLEEAHSTWSRPAPRPATGSSACSTSSACRSPGGGFRQDDGMELLKSRGVPEVWRASIAGHLDEIEELKQRITPIDRELAPIAQSNPRAQLLSTIPGIGPLISLRLRLQEIGEVSRFASPAKLVGLCRAWLRGRPVWRALGDGAAIEGRLEDASLGCGRGREPGLAPDKPLPRPLPTDRRQARQNEPGEVVGRSQAPDHLLAHAQPRRGFFRPPTVQRLVPPAFWPPDGPAWN